jgi:fatty-acyl-CoA synthase
MRGVTRGAGAGARAGMIDDMGSPTKAWVRALEATAPIERGQVPILPLLIDALAARCAARPAPGARSATLTYGALAQSAQRCARWGLAQGLQPGDAVGLLMANSPHYMAIWLGLSRIGVVTALLNTNLEGELLAHAINAVSPRRVIAAGALLGALRQARAHLQPAIGCWAWGPGDAALPRLDCAAAALPAAPLAAAERPLPALEERALFIYTSGTTGLPKAANVSHYRLLQWTHWFAGMMNVTAADRMYDCLPMYHSIGGVVATGATLVGGGTVVVRERFSASEFWQDVVGERCTLFQYIGELCRYLVASAPQPLERQHSLRLCCGNGLRADVWQEFQSRFRVPEILEYYAATEASFSLYNCEGRPGAIGKIPPFLSHRMPVVLVKFDMDTDLPVRNAAGRCERCAPNEIGEALGRVADAGSDSSGGRFEGYADAAASRGKLLRDVFTTGDAWYRSGDLMRQDEQGFFYFVDRVGDTFRWKGENVSSTEVAAVISRCPAVSDVAVYGVAVPGTEGRAGMAALVVQPGFELSVLRRHAQALPLYARPLFLRIVPAIELTGTFRLRKHELAVAGYDPARVPDPLYLDDRQADAYVPLDAARHAGIMQGTLRL